MGLNISFKGVVCDENDNAIDCKYQVHYVRQNAWNAVRDTASSYYSANAGDADSLTQDGELKANDVVLVSFWQGDGTLTNPNSFDTMLTDNEQSDGILFTDPTDPLDIAELKFNKKSYNNTIPPKVMFVSTDSIVFKIDFAGEYAGDQFGIVYNGELYVGTFSENIDFGDPTPISKPTGGVTPDTRNSLFDRFAVYAIIHDGSTADYVINVKLLPKTAPNLSWSLPSWATINRNVTASNNSNDEHSWTYQGKTLFHRQDYYGREVFPKVGLLNKTYNWNDGSNDTDNVHQYDTVADYIVDLEEVNAWGLKSNDSKPIRMKYNTPIGGLTFSPNGNSSNKVHTGEDSTGTANITDEDNRISKIEHRWKINNRDTNALISDDLIEENTNKTFNFTKTIQMLQKHYGKQVITWNDGWVEQELVYTKELPITNWLPLVNFTHMFLNDTKVKFTPNCSDIDGTVDEYKWQLYTLVPFQNGSFTLSKTDILSVDDALEIIFEAAGHYKMVLTAKDDYGDTASHSIEFDVTLTGDCVSAELVDEDLYFIFPEDIDYN